MTGRRIAAAVLAAGRATRFGAASHASKVTASFAGEPLVRHVARTALEAGATPVLVVTGHAGESVAAAVRDLPVELVANPSFADGLSTSLKAALRALPREIDGLLVLLADMPLVRQQTLRMIMDAYEGEAEAVVPTCECRDGNPVLLGRALFPLLTQIRGDQGARAVLDTPGRRLCRCQVDDPGIFADVDTREALTALAERRRSQ